MNRISRRKFLKKSSMATALGPLVFTSGSPFTRSLRGAEPGANDKVRLGLIGCGGMGRGDLETFFLNPEVDCAVICDVDDAMIAKGLEVCRARRGSKPDTVKDFRRLLERKDVDVVLIATPDHWHALPSIMACQAGKDVYVEKPLSICIAEGRAMVEAARKHDRVVQMGTQQRSAPHYTEAVEFVKSGQLGKVRLVRAWAYLDWKGELPPVADSEPPSTVDYDLWLGPARKRPFNKHRFHFSFRWYWDYSGGLMTDWGAHMIDIANWGMGIKAPNSAVSVGGKFGYPN